MKIFKYILYIIAIFTVTISVYFYIEVQTNYDDIQMVEYEIYPISYSKVAFKSNLDESKVLNPAPQLGLNLGVWKGKISLSDKLFNALQKRLCTESFVIAGDTFNGTHILENSKSKNIRVTSYTKFVNPLMVMAVSNVEWGGNSTVKHILNPAISTVGLTGKGVSLDNVSINKVDSKFYTTNGVPLRSINANVNYHGPLQMVMNPTWDANYMFVSAGDNDKPKDAYSWVDATHAYSHYISRFVGNNAGWSKNYEFKNKYQVLAHTSIMANTGWSYICSSSSFGSANNSDTFPWKDSQAIFLYVELLTSPENLSIITKSAEEHYNKIAASLTSGNAKGNIQLNRNDAIALLKSMKLDYSSVVKPGKIGKVGGSNSVSEKLAHPIQVIWAYHQLELFYASGGAV